MYIHMYMYKDSYDIMYILIPTHFLSQLLTMAANEYTYDYGSHDPPELLYYILYIIYII